MVPHLEYKRFQKGDSCTEEGCKSKKWYIDANGRKYCRNGHEQVVCVSCSCGWFESQINHWSICWGTLKLLKKEPLFQPLYFGFASSSCAVHSAVATIIWGIMINIYWEQGSDATEIGIYANCAGWWWLEELGPRSNSEEKARRKRESTCCLQRQRCNKSLFGMLSIDTVETMPLAGEY